ncbi:hypothetical protein EVG20_g3511 [Dentipellis fragilis]|uniref:Uncharacterized protein n=1 Tax=Dentipellis fragilis TaxID=205917 RepID=A0A4Y9Z1N0_9AGAM|nr:hypothetical protein EVG20_g3511 [Dentipellis fragilis]
MPSHRSPLNTVAEETRRRTRPIAGAAPGYDVALGHFSVAFGPPPAPYFTARPSVPSSVVAMRKPAPAPKRIPEGLTEWGGQLLYTISQDGEDEANSKDQRRLLQEYLYPLTNYLRYEFTRRNTGAPPLLLSSDSALGPVLHDFQPGTNGGFYPLSQPIFDMINERAFFQMPPFEPLPADLDSYMLFTPRQRQPPVSTRRELVTHYCEAKPVNVFVKHHFEGAEHVLYLGTYRLTVDASEAPGGRRYDLTTSQLRQVGQLPNAQLIPAVPPSVLESDPAWTQTLATSHFTLLPRIPYVRMTFLGFDKSAITEVESARSLSRQVWLPPSSV